MKKLLGLMLSAIMLLTILPGLTVYGADIIAGGECGAQGDNLTWTLDSEGTLTISGTGDMADWDYEKSPYYEYWSSIQSVIIGSDVTSIGGSAFYNCYKLTVVNVPDSVTSIGYGAFAGCSSLTDVNIPDGVTSIGDHTFFWCENLTGVSIPDSVTAIGDYAFCYCIRLAEISLPSSVTTIGECAFLSCGRLTSVNIPGGVTSIGTAAFSACNSLTRIDVDEANPCYKSVDGVLFNKALTELIRFPACNSKTSYSIPGSVTTIGECAFNYCSNLTGVDIPAGVTTIGEGAFYCTGLTGVNIPSGVTSIGEEAFEFCTGLADVYYSGAEAQWNAISVENGNDCLLNATIHYSSAGPDSAISVLVNGEPIAFDVPPIIIDGTTMLPVRLALEPLGAEFVWNGEEQTVTINAAGRTIVLTVDSAAACVNGAAKAMDRPAMIIDGRTLIPIRFAAEELGYDVSWDGETRTVIIK